MIGVTCLRFRRGRQMHYQCRACRHQTTLISGTLFEATKLPLATWFLAIHLLTWTKTNLSALELKRHLSVRYRTAWRIKHKIMQAMLERETSRQLDGFVLSLLVFLLLSLMARPLVHPYLKEWVFYAIEFIFIALLLPSGLFGITNQPKLNFLLNAICGYFIGFLSCISKAALFDKHTDRLKHLAEVIANTSSEAAWLWATFTYSWMLLLLAVLAGHWLARRVIYGKASAAVSDFK
jgi:hypothetical protein